MKRTLTDLLGSQKYSGPIMGMGGVDTMGQMQIPEANNERVFTVSIVLEAHEVEILDQRAVIEKRVIARNRIKALEKCGFTVKE